MAPLVVKGKVLVGNCGGEFGVRGWIKALDAASGEVAWTAYSTGPDSDVLIGPDFKPFYESDRGKDLGVTTWPPDAWKHRRRHRLGLDLVRSGPRPDLLRHRQSRPVELRPAPGRQQVDGRHLRARSRHRRGALGLPVVAARPVRLRRRQREHPARHADGRGSRGRCWCGRSATASSTCWTARPARCSRPTPFVPLTATTGVDLKTGRLQLRRRQEAADGQGDARHLSRVAGRQGLAAVVVLAPHGAPLHPAQQPLHGRRARARRTTSPARRTSARRRCSSRARAATAANIPAWDLAAGKEVWTDQGALPGLERHARHRRRPRLLRHDGRLVQGGRRAHRQAPVAVQDRLGDHRPADHLSRPRRKQYVAILSGVGGWAGAIVAADLDPRDPTAGLGFVGAMADLKDATTKGGTLYVFRLP